MASTSQRNSPTIQLTKTSIITKSRRKTTPKRARPKLTSKTANLMEETFTPNLLPLSIPIPFLSTRERPLDSRQRTTVDQQAVTIIQRSDCHIRDELVTSNIYNTSLQNTDNMQCVVCEITFFVKIKLKLHYLLDHNVQYCKHCDLLLENNEELTEHRERVHSLKICELCQVSLDTSEEQVQEHYRLVHNATTCQFCLVIIQPADAIIKHLYDKHVNNGADPVQVYETGNIFEMRGTSSSFECHMCAGSRKREIIGHFCFYHKVSVYTMAEMFREKKVDLRLTPPDVNEVTEDKLAAKEDICLVCRQEISTLVPAMFHQVFCNQMAFCKYCHKSFTTIELLDSHVFTSHAKHYCELQCSHLCYNTVDNLHKHYLQHHKVQPCPYCKNNISTESSDNLMTHLIEQHHANKTVNITSGSLTTTTTTTTKSTASGISEDDNKTVVVTCVLCLQDLSDLSPNKIYIHFVRTHSISSEKVLDLIGANTNTNKIKLELEESLETSDNEDDTVSNIDEVDSENSSQHSQTDDKEEVSYESTFDHSKVRLVFNHNDLSHDNKTTCGICTVTFNTGLEYISHLYIAHKMSLGDSHLTCKATTCLTAEKSITSLRVHLEHVITAVVSVTEDNGSKDHSCDVCDLYKGGSRDGLNEHFVEKHEVLKSDDLLERYGYRCRFCEGSWFWKRVERDEHEIQAHAEYEGNQFLECFGCNVIFASVDNLRTHSTPTSSTSCSLYHTTSPPLIHFHCTLCSLTLPNLAHLTAHYTTTHSDLYTLIRCPVTACAKVFSKRKYAQNHYRNLHKLRAEYEHVSQIDCEYCGQAFDNKKSYNLHKKNAHLKGYKCVICYEKFTTSDHRKHHYATQHLGELRFECQICQQQFNSKSALHMHKFQHNQLVSTCEYCGKEFFRRDSYKEHLQIHIGPKHQCPYCVKVFTQLSNMRRHVRIHTGEKPYQCQHCDKRFSDRGACNSHMSVHTRAQECNCPVCGKTFSKPQKMKFHLKKHTGEGLVTCPVCDKQFIEGYLFRNHLAVHTADKSRIICDCGRSFKTERYYKLHVASVHNNLDPKTNYQTNKDSLVVVPERQQLIKNDETKTDPPQFQCAICTRLFKHKRTLRAHIPRQHDIHREEVSGFIITLLPGFPIGVGTTVSSNPEDSQDNDDYSDSDDVPLKKSLIDVTLESVESIEKVESQSGLNQSVDDDNENEGVFIKTEPDFEEGVDKAESDNVEVGIVKKQGNRKHKKPIKFMDVKKEEAESE